MAIRVVTHRICDRCQRPFDEVQQKYGEDLPKYTRAVLYCELTHETAEPFVHFRFEDLCPECDRVVDGYLRKIRLEDQPKRKKGDKEEPETKPEEPEPVTATPEKHEEPIKDSRPF